MALILVEAFDGLIDGRIVNVPAGTELTVATNGAAILAAGAATFEFEEEDRGAVMGLVGAWRAVSATKRNVKLVSFLSQASGGDPAPSAAFPVRLSGASTTITSDDLHGLVIMTDSGEAMTITVPVDLADGFDFWVAYVSFDDPSGEPITVSGPSTFFIGPSVLQVGQAARYTKISDTPFRSFHSFASLPQSAYGNAGTFEPVLTSDVSVTLNGSALFSRTGKAANSGASAPLDDMDASIGFAFDLLNGETLNVSITEIPAGINNSESVRGIIQVVFADSVPATFTLSASMLDENTLRLTASGPVALAVTGYVEARLRWSALGAA